MKATQIIATRTTKDRIVTVDFDDKSQRVYTFGKVETAPGVWSLPDPEKVAAEIAAYLAALDADEPVADTDLAESPVMADLSQQADGARAALGKASEVPA